MTANDKPRREIDQLQTKIININGSTGECPIILSNNHDSESRRSIKHNIISMVSNVLSPQNNNILSPKSREHKRRKSIYSMNETEEQQVEKNYIEEVKSEGDESQKNQRASSRYAELTEVYGDQDNCEICLKPFELHAPDYNLEANLKLQKMQDILNKPFKPIMFADILSQRERQSLNSMSSHHESLPHESRR